MLQCAFKDSEHSFRCSNLDNEQIRMSMFYKEPGTIAQGIQSLEEKFTFFRLMRIVIVAITVCFTYLSYTQRSFYMRPKYSDEKWKM